MLSKEYLNEMTSEGEGTFSLERTVESHRPIKVTDESMPELPQVQVFYDQFCFDLLKLFGLTRLQEFTLSSFTDTMRQLFREVTIKVTDVAGKELRIKDIA